METVREWEAQCHRVDTGLPTQLPHSAEDGRTRRVGGTTPRYDSPVVSEDWRGGDSLLTRAPASCQKHLMLWWREWARGPRARGGLERGRDSLERASSPRARRRFARGGVQPSSEAEIRWHGARPLSEAEVCPRGAGADLLMGR
jgi:hypothetical protein